MIWLTLLLWLLCGSAKADSYAYLQMNLKNNASLNIVKAGTIKMAEDKARTPREYINQVLGLDSSGVKNVDNYLEGLAVIESDRKNLPHGSNKKSSAGGYFQFLNNDGDNGGFDGSSLDTALTRIKRVFDMLGEKLPKQFVDARTNESVTGLGFDDQATLALVNLQQNPGETNELLTAVGRGDTSAARNLYENFHLTTVNTGAEQAKTIRPKVDRTFNSWLKPVDEEPGFFDKVGQTGDILMSALGFGDSTPDKEPTTETGVDVLTAPAKEKTWDEEFEELKRVWGLYEGGIVDRSDVSERIHNIMKPRN